MKWIIIILMFASMMPGDVYVYSNGDLELQVSARIYEDDFDGTALAPDWKPVCFTTCSISVSNGRLYMSSGGGLAYVYVNETYPDDFLTIESLMYFDLAQQALIIVGYNGTHLLGVLVDEDNIVELVAINNTTGDLAILDRVSYVIIRYDWYNIRVDFNKTSYAIDVYANNSYVTSFRAPGNFSFLAGIGTYYSYMTFENFTARHAVRYVEIRNLPVGAYTSLYKKYRVQLYEGVLTSSTLRIFLDGDPPVSVILVQLNSTKVFNVTDVFGVEYDTTQVFADGFFNATPTEYIEGLSIVSVNSTNLTSAIVYVAKGVILDALYLNGTPLSFIKTNYTVAINNTIYDVYTTAFEGYGILKAVLEIPNIFYGIEPTYDGTPLTNISRIIIGDKITLSLPVNANITVTYNNVAMEYTNTSEITVNCSELGSLEIEAIYTNTSPVTIGYNIWKYNVTYGTITVDVTPAWINGLSVVVNKTYTLTKTSNTINVSSGGYNVEAFYRGALMGYRFVKVNTLNPDVSITFSVGYLEDKDYRGELRRFIWSEGLSVAISSLLKDYPYAKTKITYELTDVGYGTIFIEYDRPVDMIYVEDSTGAVVDIADNNSLVTIHVVSNGSTLLDDMLSVMVGFYDVVYGRAVISEAYFNDTVIQVSGLLVPGKYRVKVKAPDDFKLSYVVVGSRRYDSDRFVLELREPLIVNVYLKLPVIVDITGKTIDIWGNLLFYVTLTDCYGNPVADKSITVIIARNGRIIKQVSGVTDRSGGIIVSIPNAKPGTYIVSVYSPEDNNYTMVSVSEIVEVTQEEVKAPSMMVVLGVVVMVASIMSVVGIIARKMRRGSS